MSESEYAPAQPVTHKTCGRCGHEYSIEQFHKTAKHSDGLSGSCKLCDTVRRYGMNANHFRALLARQGGGCAICGCTSPVRWAVDHDHESGGVRGILCVPCNALLGLIQASVTRSGTSIGQAAEKMTSYLAGPQYAV